MLEVDHISSRPFSADDIYFLTGLGNTIARAVKLRRALQAMEAALDEKQLLNATQCAIMCAEGGDAIGGSSPTI